MASSIPKTSQFYFFLMPDESKLVLKYLIEQNCIIFSDRSKTTEPYQYKLSEDISKAYICTEELKPKIAMRKISEEVYFIDDTTSPVIEFSCSVLRESELSRGRLYFRGGYLGRDKWIAYPDDLYDIYKSVISLLKESVLTKNREYKAYISKGSKKYISEGGLISQF